MLTETSGRNAEDLAAELEGLRGVDWASVWQGPPQDGSSECRAWCGRYGWEPQTADRNLVLHSRAGGEWTLESNGNRHPVESLTHWAWHAETTEAVENARVLAQVDEVWPEFLKAAEGVLGPAAWSGPWDAHDFPEPPVRGFWPGRDHGLKTRTPYRMAFWTPTGQQPGDPCLVLAQSVSFATWTTDTPGSSRIRLGVNAPEGSRRHR
ncbi:hypothetical protein [Streptomyces sp. NPDC054865]